MPTQILPSFLSPYQSHRLNKQSRFPFQPFPPVPITSYLLRHNLPQDTDASCPQTYIRSMNLGLQTSHTDRLPFYLRTPEQPVDQDTVQQPTLDKGKSKQLPEDTNENQSEDQNKDQSKDQSKETPQDNMAPKSGYYEQSRSSSEGERVYYDPRKERRSASKTTATKRPVEVHNHNTSSGDPKRPPSIDSRRWK
jgi:hypothetical protein